MPADQSSPDIASTPPRTSSAPLADAAAERGAPSRLSFEDVEREIAQRPEEKARGDGLEHAARIFLERDPSQSLASVCLWSEWPGRFTEGSRFKAADEGIDLVGTDHDGKTVAVQVKFVRDPKSRTPWSDLATFTSQVSGHGSPFKRSILITNANDITPRVRRLVVGMHDVSLILRDALVDSPIDWSPTHKAQRSPVSRRPDQIDAVADVVRVLREHGRARLVAACGTGKTLMGLWTARDLAAQKTLVLLPSLALVRQFHAAWAAEAQSLGWQWQAYAVCSDDDALETDEIHISTAELGIRNASTDHAEIEGWLSDPEPSVVFGTYQSSPKIADAMKAAAVPPFDLVICDEAHHITTADSTSAFRVILDDQNIRATNRLFMTATESVCTSGARKKAEDAGLSVASMDDETLFGPRAHYISFGQAIELGLITDYKIVVAQIAADDAELLALLEERRYVSTEGAPVTTADTLAAALAIAQSAKRYGFQRIVSFHHRVEKGAAPFATLMKAVEPTWRVGHVSGVQSTAEREGILGQILGGLLAGERALVTNARCLGEGIDLPDLEAVAFVDPKSSVIEIVQAAGRAMRLPKTIDKRVGWIIVPVVVPAGEDPDEFLAGSNYGQVIKVVRAMRSHDERLVESIDVLCVGKGSPAAARKFITDHLVLGTAALGVDVVAWRDRITTRIIDETFDSWSVGFVHLEAYVEREGTARVPARFIEGGFRLGQWVGSVRQHRVALSPARTTSLETLRGWTWDPFDDQYTAGLTALRAFAAREGRTRAPRGHIENGINLFRWIRARRTQWRHGKLPPARIADLEAVTGWSWNPLDDQFDVGLTALRAFVARTENPRIPGDHFENGVNLSEWVRKRRQDYRAGRLSQERCALLEAVPGWTWLVADPFPERCAELAAYMASHGSLPARGSDDSSLRHWVIKVRRLRAAGRLSEAQILLTEAIPGWSWDPEDDPRVSEARYKAAVRQKMSSPDWVADQDSLWARGWVPPLLEMAMTAAGHAFSISPVEQTIVRQEHFDVWWGLERRRLDHALNTETRRAAIEIPAQWARSALSAIGVQSTDCGLALAPFCAFVNEHAKQRRRCSNKPTSRRVLQARQPQLDGSPPLTLEATGALMGVKRQRVQQIETADRSTARPSSIPLSFRVTDRRDRTTRRILDNLTQVAPFAATTDYLVRIRETQDFLVTRLSTIDPALISFLAWFRHANAFYGPPVEPVIAALYWTWLRQDRSGGRPVTPDDLDLARDLFLLTWPTEGLGMERVSGVSAASELFWWGQGDWGPRPDLVEACREFTQMQDATDFSRHQALPSSGDASTSLTTCVMCSRPIRKASESVRASGWRHRRGT